jgi:hypothetical protein
MFDIIIEMQITTKNGISISSNSITKIKVKILTPNIDKDTGGNELLIITDGSKESHKHSQFFL